MIQPSTVGTTIVPNKVMKGILYAQDPNILRQAAGSRKAFTDPFASDQRRKGSEVRKRTAQEDIHNHRAVIFE